MTHNPPLFLPLPTPEEMSGWDKSAHETYGIPPLLLMENAAQASFALLGELLLLKQPRRALVIAGKGNNGGDGAALARLLHDEGHEVLTVLTAPPDEMPSPAWEHAAMALSLGLSFHFPDADGRLRDLDALNARSGDLSGLGAAGFVPDLVIDALTGTGIKGMLRERELGLVRLINRFKGKAFILSLDIPSGLSGLSGKAMPEAVRADATICFEAGKPGLFMPGAGEYTGRLFIRRVGIPLALREKAPASWRLISPQKGSWAKPSPMSHKGEAGKTLIVGGSEGMAGAPMLAALGSLRCGSGLVHVALPEALEPAARATRPEVLVSPVGRGMRWREEDGAAIADMVDRLRPGCLVIGPGLGREPAAGELIRTVLNMPDRPPVLLDADALYFFSLPEKDAPSASASSCASSGEELLSLLKPRDILTPHPGEMARMLPRSFFIEHGCPEEATGDLAARIGILQENRAEALQCFAAASPAVLVLKGPGTLAGRRGQPIALSPFCVATLGVGGSGDVLAGVCAGLRATGMESLAAACLAVHLHGRAGEILSQRAPRGHLAGEIADAVPLAWEELCGN